MIARLGTVPVLGQLDVTAEATAYGGVLALRTLVVVGCFALHSAAVDPDDLLRAFRRVSLPLGADRRAGHAHRAGARARRAPAARRAALPRGGAGPAPGGRARGRGGRAGPRGRRRGDARGARLRRRAPAAAPRARPWSRHDLAFARERASRSSRSRRRRAGSATARLRGLPGVRGAGGRRRSCGSCAALALLRAAAVRRPAGDRRDDRRPLAPSSGVTYRYPGAAAPALRDVDLAVAPGEFVVLAGGSGSGKSTLLRAACGLVPHFHGGEFAGRLEVGGLDTRDARAGRRSPRSPARCSRIRRRRS